MHAFMAGLAMETLIHWYELQVLAGNRPDNRISAAIQPVLQFLWSQMYVPQYHSIAYNTMDLPLASSVAVSALNNLIAPAYAWYWSLTGGTTVLAQGDQLFQWAAGQANDSIFSGKQFSQLYKWGPDYVGYRNGKQFSAVVQSNNPVEGMWPDTSPPVTAGPTVTVSPVSSTAETISWNTYKPATVLVIYGTTSAYGQTAAAVDLSGKSLSSTSHSVTLDGLTPGATYHYRTIATDDGGNKAQSADLTFATTEQEKVNTGLPVRLNKCYFLVDLSL